MQLVAIGVAAQGLGVHPDTLPRLEKEGKIDPPGRTAAGPRRHALAKLGGLAPHKAP